MSNFYITHTNLKMVYTSEMLPEILIINKVEYVQLNILLGPSFVIDKILLEVNSINNKTVNNLKE